jgi:hypothetical protein
MGAMQALIEIGCGGTERRAVSASSLGQREPCVRAMNRELEPALASSMSRAVDLVL